MSISLNSPLSELSGLGPKSIEKLNRLGLYTARDLLFYFPRRYEDYTQITKIGDLGNPNIKYRNPKQSQNSKFKIQNSDVYTIKGTVLGIANKKTRRRGFTVTEAQVVDDSGTLKVVWFNQPYLVKMLQAGSSIILNGKVTEDYYGGPTSLGLRGASGLVMESPTRTNYPRIVPVYGETEGVSSWFISKIYSKLKHLVGEIEEWLPGEFLISSYVIPGSGLRPGILNKVQDPGSQAAGRDDKLELLPIEEAILNIHEPKNSEMLDAARRRLAFDELFLIALQSQLVKKELAKEIAPKIETDVEELKKFIAGLPFELTGDQKKAVWQISKDLAKNTPMNRLLSGDVGSGKTVVAAAAAFVTVKSGKKAVLMVPTSILVNQHYETFCKLFKNSEFSVGIVTADKKDNLDADILIGTQALIQPDIEIENVALTIVDEQHRFGVKQREALRELNHKYSTTPSPSSERRGIKPHFLSMTATPIPRTMYLSLFGDLDVSFLTEKPANRKIVKTRLVDAFNRDKAYRFIRELIVRGRQAFVVCPLIEDKSMSKSELQMPNEMYNDKFSNVQLFEEERKTVMAESEKLKKIFPEFKIATLHGRMKAKEKDAIMADFAANRVNILVSTSVVEVGVDVPNAAVMLIEDAERFGLATIHQFRGRVGRADHQSFCFLFSNSQSEKALNRLKSLEEISDGYKLAEIDLETRGFGSILGVEQSGIMDMKMANFSDKILLEEAGEAAAKIAPEIEKYPILKEKISSFGQNHHLE